VDVGALVGDTCPEVLVPELVDDQGGLFEATLGRLEAVEQEVGEGERRQGLAAQHEQVLVRSAFGCSVDRGQGSLQGPLRLDGASGAVVGGSLVPEGARLLQQVDDRCLTSPFRAGVTPRSSG
jgi:hypothetical protein